MMLTYEQTVDYFQQQHREHMVYYLAGPYRGKHPRDTWQNIMAARDDAMALWDAGLIILCPHLNTILMDCGDDQRWIDGTLALMRVCHGVIVRKGWELSYGTLGEIAEAERIGLPVMDYIFAKGVVDDCNLRMHELRG